MKHSLVMPYRIFRDLLVSLRKMAAQTPMDMILLQKGCRLHGMRLSHRLQRNVRMIAVTQWR